MWIEGAEARSALGIMGVISEETGGGGFGGAYIDTAAPKTRQDPKVQYDAKLVCKDKAYKLRGQP